MLVTDRTRFAAPAGDEVFDAGEWRVLSQVAGAGVGAIQVREKDLGGDALLRRVSELAALVEKSATRILVNDRADVARLTPADGVHLPEAGLPTPAARSVLGPHAVVGRSIHRLEQATSSQGLDYFVFGPIFDTPSKRRYGKPQGLERLRAVSEASALPVIAIGGITPERVASVLRHGARGVAVMGALLAAREPGRLVADYVRALADD